MNVTIKTLINAVSTDYRTAESILGCDVQGMSILELVTKVKSAYPQIPRYIGVSDNTLQAIDAAYKTASGLYSEDLGEICSSIYTMSKTQLALVIVSNDRTDEAFDRACFEIARDAFVSSSISERAKELAEASGRDLEDCSTVIQTKLDWLTKKMNGYSDRLLDSGETPESPESIAAEIIEKGGAYLLQLPTAYGKTSKIIEPAIKHYVANGKKVVVISHRRSINANFATDIDGFVSYDACTEPSILAGAKALKIVVNSISSERFAGWLQDVDMVIMDEASQIISHILGGEVKGREAVWNTLSSLVKRTSSVIMADADITGRCVQMIEREAPVKLYKVAQAHSEITIRTSSVDQASAMIVADAVAGKKVFVACDVRADAEALGKRIEKATGAAPLIITAKNARWVEQAEFIANPNATKQQVVIFSPVITSALSITKAHFESHYGLFSGSVVPSDCIQMLRRDRTAKALVVGLRNPQYRKVEAVDVEFNLKKNTLKNTLAAIHQLDLPDFAKRTLIEATRKDTDRFAFDLLRHEFCCAEAWLKDNIQNTLPATLLQQGFRVEVLERNDDQISEGYQHRIQGRKAVKRANAKAVFAAKATDALTAYKAKNEGTVDEEQHYEVVRLRAQEVLRKVDLTADDAAFWGEGEGESKVCKFRKLWSMQHLKSYEQATFALILPALAQLILTKQWRSADSSELFDSLNAIRDQVIASGVSMGTPKTAQAKQSAVTRLLSAFGLKTRKVDGGASGDYYVVDIKSLDLMTSYI